MSRTAKCQKHRGKVHVLKNGVALSAALPNNALRSDLKNIWPELDDSDLDLLIEHAECLVESKRGGSV